MEVVLADGTIVCDSFSETGCNQLRKDNTGYDLKQLFIGSEGTLGVITKVALLCPPRMASVNVGILAAKSYEDVVKTFCAAKHRLGEIISAFEFFDRESVECVFKAIPGAKDPLDDVHPFYCLIETAGSNRGHDQEKLSDFLEHTMSIDLISNGVLAQDESQCAQFWKIRESIPVALSELGNRNAFSYFPE